MGQGSYDYYYLFFNFIPGSICSPVIMHSTFLYYLQSLFKFNGIKALAYLTLRMSFQVIYSKLLSLYDKRHYMKHVILIFFFFRNDVDVVQRHATSLTLKCNFLSTRV